ncbi:nuclear transport factor 2 family protein [Sediminitomix flava]|uniref:Putative lumazine-binding protein n=1 Tax=Sediminitomix flava TaxID=379075 RepID=A0A315ZZ08_SEDFL|nr:nuclear transport factor 2 family protein [Sediminitomix flava]PWJ42607.1 putative lumazine-binding protein [Sediminitomix flava]
MKKFIAIITLLLSTSFFVSAQDIDKQEIKATIQKLFDGMRASDKTAVENVFAPNAQLFTIVGGEGETNVRKGKLEDFLNAIAAPHELVFDERIWSYKIETDGMLATAWTEYTFFLGEHMSHCGVNAFQLYKADEEWLILQITDTRKKYDCKTEPTNNSQLTKELDLLLDNWHKAAAKADADAYFGKIAESGIYLGTDKTERWTKEKFWSFAKPYFDKGKAWDFKATKRDIVFGENNKYAWFDELLDTWMGTCRGSGVLKFENGEWLIEQYNLTVTVPNDKIQDVIKAIGENTK